MKIATVHKHKQQRGVALVAALMIMMILTILGITVMNMTTLEERMAFNTQDRYMARNLAESAILFLARNNNLPPPNQAGASEVQYTNLTADIPQLGMDAGSGRIVYVESTAINNMRPINPKATYLAGGVAVNPNNESPNSGVPVFMFSVTATTKAGTTANQARAGYFFAGATTVSQ